MNKYEKFHMIENYKYFLKMIAKLGLYQIEFNKSSPII